MLEDELKIYESEQTKAEITLDKNIKLLTLTQEQLKELENDKNEFNMVNISSDQKQKRKIYF